MPKNKRLKTYPFPYLADYTEDYKMSKFTLETSFVHTQGKLIFRLSYSINNDEFKELIKNKIVKVIAKIKCPILGFSETKEFESDSHTLEVSYNSMELDEDVFVEAYLVSNTDFLLENSDVCDEWADIQPTIQANNVVGETNECVITVSHIKKGNSKSIFKFTYKADINTGEPYEVNLDYNDYIEFRVSQAMFYQFNTLKDKAKEFIHAVFIIPTLTDILRQMANPSDADEDYVNDFNDRYSGKKWYGVLFDNYGKAFDGANPIDNPKNPLVAAQAIIDKRAYSNVLAEGVKKVGYR